MREVTESETLRWRTLSDAEINALLEKGPIIVDPAFQIGPALARISRAAQDEDAANHCIAEISEEAVTRDVQVKGVVTKNLDIICDTFRKQGISQTRLRFAAYRLFRYENLSPRDICKLLLIRGIKVTPYRVQDWIGMAFREICLAHDSCVFKPYLTA